MCIFFPNMELEITMQKTFAVSETRKELQLTNPEIEFIKATLFFGSITKVKDILKRKEKEICM